MAGSKFFNPTEPQREGDESTEKRAPQARRAPRKRAYRRADDKPGRPDNQRERGDIERPENRADIAQPHPDALRASTLPLQGRVVAATRRLFLAVRLWGGLAVHAGERRGGGGALVLVLVLLRFLLFLVASHLAFRHGVLRVRGE